MTGLPSSSSASSAKCYGVELVGGSVKENRGVLSGFSTGSYAKIRAPFDTSDKSVEVVIDCETGANVSGGLLSSIGKHGIVPFFIAGEQLTFFLSTDGLTWNIAARKPIGLALSPKTSYRIKVVWKNKAYSWFVWEKTQWRKLLEIPCDVSAFNGVDFILGAGRLFNNPFSGLIYLDKCYICVDGKLWWEGVKGAYKNANK